MTRVLEIEAFLNKAGWSKVQRTPLAGDAGNRRYERLIDPVQGSAILMDAEPKLGEDIRSFLKISLHLSDCEISAPKIFSQYEIKQFTVCCGFWVTFSLWIISILNGCR